MDTVENTAPPANRVGGFLFRLLGMFVLLAGLMLVGTCSRKFFGVFGNDDPNLFGLFMFGAVTIFLAIKSAFGPKGMRGLGTILLLMLFLGCLASVANIMQLYGPATQIVPGVVLFRGP